MINANDFFEISFKKDYNSVPYKLIKKMQIISIKLVSD